MKIITILAITVLLLSGSLASAATINASTNPHPNIHQINMNLKSEWMQIRTGEKSGQLTTTQGNTLKASLKSIRQQEVVFIKANGNHELTAEQTTQLTASLTQIEQTLTSTGVPPAPTPSIHH